jgi:hypothetical protein
MRQGNKTSIKDIASEINLIEIGIGLELLNCLN